MAVIPRKLATNPTVAPKKFSVRTLDGSGCGEKILLYGESGMGKTTLAAQAPNPIFIALDDGSRKIKNPRTDKAVKAVDGVESYQDVRDALHQADLWPATSTCVIDTVTVLQDLAEAHVLLHVKTENGASAKNILSYGWNKGFKHLFDAMKCVLSDLDTLVKRNVNVLLIAQSIPARIPNPGGADFTREGPSLYAGSPSIRALYREWCDHVLRLGYLNAFIDLPDAQARKGKIRGTTDRAVFVQPELYFEAKSRTIHEPVVAFESPDDDTIWSHFIFGGR